MTDLPPPPAPKVDKKVVKPENRPGPWLKRRFLRVPVWVWIAGIVAAGALASARSDSESNSAGDDIASGEAVSPDPTTTTIFYRYESSDDPIENLLWIANSETVALPGWNLLGRTTTDDDLVFDDIRINAAEGVDYQNLDDAIALIDVAEAIVDRAMAPVQIDIRINVTHSEVQPDGSIEYDDVRREWIEVTGDKDSFFVTIDVYGFLPEDEEDLTDLQQQLKGKYPDAVVKLTDTSMFDD